MTPDLIAILAIGATVIGLLIAQRREARADNRSLRAEFRADNQALRAEVKADNQALRAELHAQIQDLRSEVHAGDQRLREDLHAEMSSLRADLSNLSTDVQSLTERTARLEGAIQGLAATHHDRTRHDAAA